MGAKVRKENQQQLFNTLYSNCAEDIISFIVRRTRTQSEAADVFAEVMLIAWRRIGEIPQGDDARLWLFGVARNVLKNSARSWGRRKRLIEKVASQIERPMELISTEFDERTAFVQGALKQLRPIEEEIVCLNIWEQLTPTEIAVSMEMRPETVRTHLHRARTKLRNILEPINENSVPDIAIGGE